LLFSRSLIALFLHHGRYTMTVLDKSTMNQELA
jgi:hypothetical protein